MASPAFPAKAGHVRVVCISGAPSPVTRMRMHRGRVRCCGSHPARPDVLPHEFQTPTVWRTTPDSSRFRTATSLCTQVRVTRGRVAARSAPATGAADSVALVLTPAVTLCVCSVWCDLAPPGDFSNCGSKGEVARFAEWFAAQPHKHKVRDHTTFYAPPVTRLASDTTCVCTRWCRGGCGGGGGCPPRWWWQGTMTPSWSAATTKRVVRSGFMTVLSRVSWQPHCTHLVTLHDVVVAACACAGTAEECRAMFDVPGVTYLEDAGTEIMGLKIWGYAPLPLPPLQHPLYPHPVASMTDSGPHCSR